MRLCAHVRQLVGSAKPLSGTGSNGTYLTPDRMLNRYSIDTQAKAQMLRPPDCFLQIYKLGQYRNAFLAKTYIALVSRCKSTNFLRHGKILFPPMGKKCYLCGMLINPE